ncbi:hypothetical protein L9F63_007949, partial [Diploptera punctata]
WFNEDGFRSIDVYNMLLIVLFQLVRSYDDLKLSIFLFSVSIFCFMAVYCNYCMFCLME